MPKIIVIMCGQSYHVMQTSRRERKELKNLQRKARWGLIVWDQELALTICGSPTEDSDYLLFFSFPLSFDLPRPALGRK
jgi:hypothetical protein